MTHIATQIRTRVKTVLRASTRVEESAIYTSRFFPTTVLPCIGIYDRQERNVNLSAVLDGLVNADTEYEREADINIEVRATDVSDPDGAADAIRLEVEQLMAADPQLNSLVETCYWIGTSKQHLQSETPIVACVLTYRVRYVTTAADPETRI